MVLGLFTSLIALKAVKESFDLVKDTSKAPRPNTRTPSNIQNNDRRINDLSNNILKNFSTFKKRGV